MEEDYSQASFESNSDHEGREVRMTDPKYDETQAPELAIDEIIHTESPIPKNIGALEAAHAREEASVIVHKGVEDSTFVQPRLVPPSAAPSSRASDEPAAKPAVETGEEGSERPVAPSNVSRAILGYESSKRVPAEQLRITDLREARLHKGKESFILVSRFIPPY